MFSKIAIVIFTAAAFVAAAPADPVPITTTTTTINKCNVGSLQCCKSVQKPDSQAVQHQAGVLQLAAGALQGMIGLQCNPITGLIGVAAGANCNANPVCCKGNHGNGLLAVDCTPVNVNV